MIVSIIALIENLPSKFMPIYSKIVLGEIYYSLLAGNSADCTR